MPESPDKTAPYAQQQARKKHQKWYWENHDRDVYECPDCGRTEGDDWFLQVHHRDGDPFNGDPENLVALCPRCHKRRHRKERLNNRLEDLTSF